MKYIIAIILLISIISNGLSDGFYFKEVKFGYRKLWRDVFYFIQLTALAIGFYLIKNDLYAAFNYGLGYIAFRFTFFDMFWNLATGNRIFYIGVKGAYAKFLKNNPVWMIVFAKLFSLFLGLLFWDIINF